MRISLLFDQLFPRENIAWPENDRPDELKIARVFNMMIQSFGVPKGAFWADLDKNTQANRMLVYLDLDQQCPEATFSEVTIEELLKNITEGLDLWSKTKNVRFNEEMTSFLGVGPASSRKFAPPNMVGLLSETKDINAIIPEKLQPILEAYNKERATIALLKNPEKNDT